MTNLWKYFWLHTRKAWKIHVVFMTVSAGFWPLGSKNTPNQRKTGNDLTRLCGAKSLPGHMCFCSRSSPWGFRSGGRLHATALQTRYRPPRQSRCSLSSFATRKSAHNHGALSLGDRAALLFIIPNLEDILWNYFLPVVGLNTFTLLLTVPPKRAKWLLQLRSVLPTLQPPDLKSTSHAFFFIVTAKHSRINCYKKGSLL